MTLAFWRAWTRSNLGLLCKSRRARRAQPRLEGLEDRTLLSLFGPPIPLLTGDLLGSVTTADFNGDGRPDLAAVGFRTDVMRVLLNAGGDTFTPAPGSPYPTGFKPVQVVAADFNGDGRIDLATANQSSRTVTTFFNNSGASLGTKTFVQISTSPDIGQGPFSLAVGDFNGDGHPDVITANLNGSATVLLNDGTGNLTFGSEINLTVVSPDEIAVGDLNGDGNADFVVVGGTGNGVNNVGEFLGDGTGRFRASSTFGTGPFSLAQAVALGDLTGSGKLDVVAAVSLPSGPNLFVFRSDGTTQSYSAGFSSQAVALGDFNGDNKLDIALGGGDNTVNVLLNQGDGTFRLANTTNVGAVPLSLAVGDFTGTGRPDLAMTTENGLSILVNQPATTTTLSSAQNPTTFGQAVTLTAKVTSTTTNRYTPAGTVTFMDGTTPLGSAALSNGQATLTTSTLSPGAHFFTANYVDSTGLEPSTSAALVQTVQQGTTTLAMTTTPSAPVAGQPVTFKTTLSVNAPGAGTPTGTVTFAVDGVVRGLVPVDNTGASSFMTTGLSVGPHTILAAYSGDSNFSASTASSNLTIAQAGTSTSLTSSSNPPVAGLPITLTATVSATPPASGMPTGMVTFLDGATTLGKASLAGGTATFTTGPITGGSHSFTASYAGSADFAASASPVLGQGALISTTTGLTASTTSTVIGRPVTLTATVTGALPAASSPTGSVTFSNGSAILGMATLSGTTATITVPSLPVGSNALAAAYSGDAAFSSSTAQAVTVNVAKAPSATVLSLATNPALIGQTVTFTATVTGAAPAGGPTGPVSFADGATILGMTSLANGVATFSIATLPGGAHTISASYGGDGQFAASTSTVATQFVLDATQHFIARVYQDLLGRLVDPSGLTFWTTFLEQKANSRSLMVQRVETSPEFRTLEVNQVYASLLHRPADPGGLNFFVGLLGSGGTVEQVQSLIAGSREYFQNRGGSNVAGFLQSLYQDALHRDVDPASQAFFTQQINSGASLGQAAQSVFQSNEYRKNLVMSFYVRYLRRPAEPAGLSFFVSSLQNGVSDEHVTAGIVSSDEYLNLQ